MRRRSVITVFFIFMLLTAWFIYSEARKGIAVSIENTPTLHNNQGNAEVQMLLPKDQTGDQRFYLGRAKFLPGASVAEHVHETSVELVYVTSGSGMFTMSGKQYEVKTGSALYIPENTPHSFSNTGNGPVEIIQVYSPAGPEERFKSWK